ncbi:MAG: hypothetical protein AAF264_07070, partial [Pseudomonadota bacterium]
MDRSFDRPIRPILQSATTLGRRQHPFTEARVPRRVQPEGRSDIWAIIFTLIQPSMDNPDIMKILASFAGIGILIVIAVILSR